MSLVPPTTGKIIIHSSKGDIEIDLWCKEVPNATKAFLTKCALGLYNGTAFDIIEPGYMVQTATSKDIDYLLQDEFHSRIRWNERGMLGAIYGDKRNRHLVDSFFITLTSTPELSNKAILLGKIKGAESWYSLLKISESELDDTGKPRFPVTITLVEVVSSFFENLTSVIPEVDGPEKKRVKKESKGKQPKVRIAFADSENEDEKEDVQYLEIKMKSANESLYDYSDKKQDVNNTSNKNSEPRSQHIQQPNQEFVDKLESINNQPVNEQSLNEETEHNEDVEKSGKASPNLRDPTIDTDYDSELEFNGITIDEAKLRKHRFSSKSASAMHY